MDYNVISSPSAIYNDLVAYCQKERIGSIENFKEKEHACRPEGQYDVGYYKSTKQLIIIRKSDKDITETRIYLSDL